MLSRQYDCQPFHCQSTLANFSVFQLLFWIRVALRVYFWGKPSPELEIYWGQFLAEFEIIPKLKTKLWVARPNKTGNDNLFDQFFLLVYLQRELDLCRPREKTMIKCNCKTETKVENPQKYTDAWHWFDCFQLVSCVCGMRNDGNPNQ